MTYFEYLRKPRKRNKKKRTNKVASNNKRVKRVKRVKLGIVMGLNYINQSGELHGCVHDCRRMRQMLRDKFGFQHKHITTMTDYSRKKPTRDNIVKTLRWAARRSKKGDVDQVYIAYSGHGSKVVDTSGDEKDGWDECIIPLDHATAGVITDDEMKSILKGFHKNTKVTLVIDACHSGTICDLKYTFEMGKNMRFSEHREKTLQANVLMISGCRDDQYSSDAYNLDNNEQYSGALTSAFFDTLKNNQYNIRCFDLIRKIRQYLVKRGFDQIPQISSSRIIDKNTLFCKHGKKNSTAYL